MKKSISFDCLFSEDINLKFIKPFTLSYTIHDNYYLADHDDLGYLGFEKSLEKLEKDFKEHLIIDWQMYVTCPKEELSHDALELRFKLEKLLQEF